MESFMLTLYVETAVREKFTLRKHLHTHHSKELHLHQCSCMTVRAREKCTVHMQAYVAGKVRVGTYVCEINYTFGNTLLE